MNDLGHQTFSLFMVLFENLQVYLELTACSMMTDFLSFGLSG